MTRIAYLKCPTGVSGDMFLGALIDAGLPWEYSVSAMESLGISDEYHLEQKKVVRNTQEATKVSVRLTHEEHHHEHHHHHGRHLPEIEALIIGSTISDRAKEMSLSIFQKLAVAEGNVHGIPPEKVHFHEVGATDAIIDIVGTCVGLDWLQIEKLYCSALPTGGGTIKAAHGLLSVPVPAVLQLFQSRKVPTYDNGIAKELVTPTGAAIVTTVAKAFGSSPEMKIEKVGLGAGSRELDLPNILQLWLGEIQEVSWQEEEIIVLETQIDDLNPQVIAYTTELLLESGALDVFTQGITMKKSRSGILLSVICHLDSAKKCKDIIFEETTTLGIRERVQTRSILHRLIHEIQTPYGVVKVKVAMDAQQGSVINIQPEYEDCAALARKHNLPLRTIQQLAISIATAQIKT